MTDGLDFIAIDFETATGKRSSICEAGICVVKDGKVVETKSWLVRPEDNAYSYWNIQIHGIHPEDTENAPEFPEVWAEILEYLTDQYLLHTMRHLTFLVFENLWSSIILILLKLTTIAHFVQLVIIMTLDAIPLVIFANSLIYRKVSTTVQAMMRKCVPDCFLEKSKMQDGVS